MKSYSSREVLQKLQEDGWYIAKHDGTSHYQLKHPIKPGKVTVKHPQKDVPISTLKAIEKQSGVSF